MMPRTARPALPQIKLSVLVDFDGMIVPDDATDGLLARYADPGWRLIEERWQRGEISGIECMAGQVGLLRATPAEVARFLDGVRVDPHFRFFLRLCRARGAEVTVVSDGMDLVVSRVLRRARLEVAYVANELSWRGEDRWTLRFPHARADCTARIGNCKCGHLRPRPGALAVMVGDGRSDFCIAERCDFVLAKGALAGHCRRLGLPHAEVRDFADARRRLAAWLRRRPLAALAAKQASPAALRALKPAS